MVAPVIGAAIAGSVVSGIMNQNSANRQMRFQKEMSNTAWQRAVKDMKAAGINPILAAKTGPASSPSGASATMPDLGTTYNTAQQVQNQGELIEKQKEKIDQEIDNLIAQENLTNEQANNVKQLTEKITQEARSLEYENVYKEIIATHQKNNPNMTVAKYYGIDAKTLASIISGAAIGKGISSREGNKNTYNYNNSEINWTSPYRPNK
jgi:hypothetical protein